MKERSVDVYDPQPVNEASVQIVREGEGWRIGEGTRKKSASAHF